MSDASNSTLWLPVLSVDTLIASDLPPSLSPRSPVAPPAATSVRFASDGWHGLTRTAARQIWRPDSRERAPIAAVLVPLDALTPQRLATVLLFWAHALGRPISAPPVLSRERRRRLILGLRALDGRATGASHRTLAQGLFGADRVPTGPSWKTHDLRSRTLRLLVDAGRLRDGGYRDLLTAGPALRLR
ncbi:MAG: DUF2285 domain-containing protein [Methylocystis sp.]|nr:DUF2285 domain-containing protein [Methylocystis sp.]MCA3582833.1 DUF2285 domain-containing protein [Methylocystis sp.]MCA3588521.1 DUF2285 domain-containing protein [Methylocystis sp.]MCA3590592.1 DUF2285 domain-containing protein [Methylocystis sp.]